MTTNKPEVVAWSWDYRGQLMLTTAYSRALELAEPPYPTEVEPLVRLSDYQRLQADHERLQAECEKLRKDAEFGRSVLSKRESGKAYVCHCDLEEDMEPDGCVIDSGERHNCVYARRIETKEQCEYWRVIASDAAIQDTTHDP